MSKYTGLCRGLILGLSVFLVACEQVQINGPIGDANVRVQELYTDVTISPDGLMTGNADDAEALFAADWPGFSDFQRLTLIGWLQLNNVVDVDPDTWYLIHIMGGFDYDPDGNLQIDQGPTQVVGHGVHALMTGDLIQKSGHVIGPLSEAAWRWVEPFYEYMTPAELEAALNEFAVATVIDILGADDVHDYRDLLTFNPYFHPVATNFKGSVDLLNSLKTAMANGEDADFRRGIVQNMVSLSAPVGAAEAMLRERISPDILQGAGGCVTCHVTGGVAGFTRYVLVPSSNSNHLSINLQRYEDLVDTVGVSTILGKAQGTISHGGGTRITQGTELANDFETWLDLL